MKANNLIKALLATATLSLGLNAFAAQHELSITGNFVKNVNAAESFGVTATSSPVNFKIIIDDSTGLTVIPGGTDLTGSGVNFAQDVTLVDISSVVSVDVTIGDSTWSLNDIVRSPGLGNTGLTYHIFLDGTLSANNISQAKLRLANNSLGYVDIGQFSCSPVCSLLNTAATFDYSNNTSGSITSVALDVNTVQESTVAKIDELQDQVEDLGVGEAILDAAEAKYEAKGGDSPATANKLEAFKNQIEAQRGRKLTDAQADKLLQDAQGIIDSL